MGKLSVRKLLLYISVALTLLLLTIALSGVGLFSAYNFLKDTQQKHRRGLEVLAELRQTSDDLSKYIRAYASTNNPWFEEVYFTILDIYSGNAPRPLNYHRIYWDLYVTRGQKPRPDREALPFSTMFLEAGFNQLEYSKLQEAERFSGYLSAIENEAISALKGIFKDESGAFSVRGNPDPQKALDLIYSNDFIRFKAKTMATIDELYTLYDARLTKQLELANRKIFVRLLTLILVGGVIILLIFYLIYILYSAGITKIDQMISYFKRISEGDISIEVEEKKYLTEVGQLAGLASEIAGYLSAKSDFILEVSKGNLTANVSVSGKNDSLGKALADMLVQLSQIQKEERERGWANEGMAKFAQLMRESTDINELAPVLVGALVGYTQSLQGALYVANVSDGKTYLELIGTYAYDRQKFVNDRVEPGDGLIGQIYIERNMMHLEEIPENYIKIRTGLGETLPKAALIMPLIANDVCEGVLELAAYQPFDDYKISFIEKLGEAIASHIAIAKISERTRVLLEQADNQRKMLTEQEEQMRQNFEELSATQEEMTRKEQEYLLRISQLEAQLEKINLTNEK